MTIFAVLNAFFKTKTMFWHGPVSGNLPIGSSITSTFPIFRMYKEHCWVPHVVYCVCLPMVLRVQSLVECSDGSLGDVLPLQLAWRTVKTWQAQNSFAFVFEESVANKARKSLKLPLTVQPVISSHLTFLQDLMLPKTFNVFYHRKLFCFLQSHSFFLFLSLLSTAQEMFCFLWLSL